MVPVLYHGTSRARAARILREGFKASKHGHYLGHGVCLSECITVAYEHGAFEEGRVVLQVQLGGETAWSDEAGGDIDVFLRTGPVAAVRLYWGNVWVIWPARVVATVRALSREEALATLEQRFADHGQEGGYNGVVQQLADRYWSARVAPASSIAP